MLSSFSTSARTARVVGSWAFAKSVIQRDCAQDKPLDERRPGLPRLALETDSTRVITLGGTGYCTVRSSKASHSATTASPITAKTPT